MSKNTIRRAKYDDTNPYFIKARQTSQDKNLSYEARGMLDYLLSKPGDWEVQVNDLMIPKKCGRDKVYGIINELVEFRYMKKPVKSQGEKGRWNWTTYEVYERPYPENPSTEKPYTDDPSTENTEIIQNKELQFAESQIADDKNSVSPSVNKPQSTPEKKERKPNQNQILVEALVLAFGYKIDQMTSSAIGVFRSAAKELTSVNFAAEEIPALYAYVDERRKKENWTSFSAKALSKYFPDYQKWKAVQQRRKEEQDWENGTGKPTLTDEQKKQMDDIFADLDDKFSGKQASA